MIKDYSDELQYLDKSYVELLLNVLNYGENVKDDAHTGHASRCIFGTGIKINVSERFPLLTIKKMNFDNVIGELLWFISGSQYTSFFGENNIRNIWKPWQREDGYVGKMYGYQWRNWDSKPTSIDNTSVGIDQLNNIIHNINTKPQSRRHVVTAHNPSDASDQALFPCHIGYTFYINEYRDIDISVRMRSNDLFIGAPYNIASYAALLYMVGMLTNTRPRKLSYYIEHAHIYEAHIAAVERMVDREHWRISPKLYLNTNRKGIDDFILEDFYLEGYEHGKFYKGKIIV